MAAYSVVTLPQAEIDVTEAADYIAHDSHMAALRWIEGLESSMTQLAEMPTSFARIPEEGRFRRDYRQFHYHSHRVIFFVDEAAKRIAIVRVVHGSRDRLAPRDVPT